MPFKKQFEPEGSPLWFEPLDVPLDVPLDLIA